MVHLVSLSLNSHSLAPLPLPRCVQRPKWKKMMMRMRSISGRSNLALARHGKPWMFPSSWICSSSLVSGSLSLSPLHLDHPPLHHRMPSVSAAGAMPSDEHQRQEPTVTNRVYMEIKVVSVGGAGADGGKEAPHHHDADHNLESESASARIEIQLYGDLLPSIVHHFTLLCTDKGDKEFSYRGSKFNRIDTWDRFIEGGIVDRITDDAGTKITIKYPHYTIQDMEKQGVGVQIVDKGSVVMKCQHDCGVGYTTYGSQFLILTHEEGPKVFLTWTLIPIRDEPENTGEEDKKENTFGPPPLQPNDLVFGKVSKGLDKFLHLIEQVKDENPDRIHPHKKLVITDCGEITTPH